MQLPDLINASFEVMGGVFVAMHIRAVRIDKQVRGLSKYAILAFSVWGVWNIFYYPYLHQWISSVGAVFTAVGNAIYVYYLWKYRNE